MDILLSKFIPEEDDVHQMKEEMEIMVQRMLVKHLTCVADLDPVLLKHIPHKYKTESARKSTVVSITNMVLILVSHHFFCHFAAKS